MAGNRVISAVLTLKDKNFGTTAQKSSSAMKDLERKTKHSGNTVSKFGKSATSSFKKVALGAAGMVAGLIAFNTIKNFGSSVISTFADYEQGMANVKAVSGATGAEFDLLKDKAREMGRATSKTAAEAADGLQYLALAGWSTEQMLSGIEPVLRLSEAGALDLGRASDLATDSMAALGIGVDGLEGYLDKVAQTARKSNTNIDTLMEGMVIAGGTFSRFNIPLEEANSFLGVLANRGTKGAEAGTAINSIMDRMTKSTGPAAKAMKELGVSAYDNKGNFRGMEVVMKETQKALSGMTDKQKSNYQSQIAGLNHGKSFEKMMQGLGDEYDDLKKNIEGADGALNEMADTQMDTFQGSMKLMGSAIDDVKITIGEKFAPAIRKMADMVSANMPAIQKHVEIAMGKVAGMKDGLIDMYNKVKPGLDWLKGTAFPAVKGELVGMYEASKPGLEWLKDVAFPGMVDAVVFAIEKFTEMYNFVKNNLSLITPVVAGIAATIATFKIGIVVITAAKAAWAGVTTAVQIATALLNGTLAISPLGWVALAIGAVVAVGILLYKNFDKVKLAAGWLWDKLLDNPMLALVAGPFGAIIAAGVTLYKNFDKIKAAFDAFKSAISKFELPGWVKTIGKTFGAVTGAVKNAFSKDKPEQSFAVGTNRVKKDMTAQIHKDEMIIPARQSANLRKQGVTIDNVDKTRTSNVTVQSNGGKSGGVTVIIENFNTAGLTAKEMVDEFVPMLKLRLANV